MLKGINVLNTYDVVSSEYNDIIVPAVAFTCIAVALIIIIIYILLNSKQKRDAFVPCAICVFLLFISLFASIY